jgi:hypothetical protein
MDRTAVVASFSMCMAMLVAAPAMALNTGVAEAGLPSAADYSSGLLA